MKAQARQRASSPPSNDPATLFGVSPQVREEACEKVMAAHYPGDQGPETRRLVRSDLDAAVPVIAGAAYKEGQEEARKRIKDAIYDLTGTEFYRAEIIAAIDKEGEGK